MGFGAASAGNPSKLTLFVYTLNSDVKNFECVVCFAYLFDSTVVGFVVDLLERQKQTIFVFDLVLDVTINVEFKKWSILLS